VGVHKNSRERQQRWHRDAAVELVGPLDGDDGQGRGQALRPIDASLRGPLSRRVETVALDLPRLSATRDA